MNKRKFLKKSFYGILGVGVLSGLYAWQIEPFWLEFVKVQLPIKNLPENLKGKTLMQISDIHVGDRFDYNYIIDSFKEAQKLNPDFVVYTGDFVSYDKDNNFEDLKKVFENPVKGSLGTGGILVIFVYGENWEEPEVANSIVRILEESGVKTLRNEAVTIEGLNLIGFDDYWGTNFNPTKALSELNIEEPNLVLCHNPDVCDLDVWQDYKGWILAGHTNGGQVKPPFLPPPMLPVKNKKYSSGEIDLGDGRTLYINRALGHLWQVRFNVRPEITVFELC